MEQQNLFLLVKAAVVGLAGAFLTAFGWLGWLVLIWVACMVLDYLTGSAAAIRAGRWGSVQAFTGIWHKAGMIAVVTVAALADSVLAAAAQNLTDFSMPYRVLLLPVVLLWYILTELGSILENAAALGAPVPQFLFKALAAAADTAGADAAGQTR